MDENTLFRHLFLYSNEQKHVIFDMYDTNIGEHTTWKRTQKATASRHDKCFDTKCTSNTA